MRRVMLAVSACVISLGLAVAEEPGKGVEFAGMKSAAPAGWKQEPPANQFRTDQYKLPGEAKDGSEDAELALFVFPGGSGTLEQNLARQVNKFEAEGRKDKTDKTKVGGTEATYQDVTGTYVKKAFPMAATGTAMPDYRQLYVVFEKDGKQYYMTLLGPAKTVEKHKAGFEDWLKNFK